MLESIAHNLCGSKFVAFPLQLVSVWIGAQGVGVLALQQTSSVLMASRALAVSLAGVVLTVALVYTLTPPVNLAEAEDAPYYAYRVATGTAQWHPNHLLYEPFFDLLVSILRALGLEANVLAVMQVVSIAAAVVSVALTFRLARRVAASPALAGAAALATAFSFAFWHYGQVPDTYALPLPFMLAALLLLRRHLASTASVEAAPTRQNLAAMATLAAAATLLHQQHVFLAVGIAMVLGAWGVLRSVQRPAASAVDVILFVLVYGAIVSAVYLWIGFGPVGAETITEFIAWSKGHAQNGMWTEWSWTSPAKSFVSLATAIWSTSFLFANPDVTDLLVQWFPHKRFVEEAFVAETSLQGRAALLWISVLVSAASMFWLLARAVFTTARTRRHLGASRWRSATLWSLGPVAVVYAVAVTAWEPTNREFWIAVLPLIFVLLIAFPKPARETGVAASVLVVSLFVANLFGAIVPYTYDRSDYWRMVNSYLTDTPASGDLILTRCGYICHGYLRLYGRATAIDVRWMTPGEIDELQTGGWRGRVYVSSWVFETPDFPRFRSTTTQPTEHADLYSRLEERLVLVDQRFGQRVYRLDRP